MQYKSYVYLNDDISSNVVSDIYVGEDGKLHKVIGGADTVLPFNNKGSLQMNTISLGKASFNVIIGEIYGIAYYSVNDNNGLSISGATILNSNSYGGSNCGGGGCYLVKAISSIINVVMNKDPNVTRQRIYLLSVN